MENAYQVLRFLHVMSFVFMAIPLFNLIIVNERAALGVAFDYQTDRYMENVIRHGATRCFVFQATAFVTGLLLLLFGGMGIAALWTNWVLLAKLILLLVLSALLTYVHFKLQPTIDAILAEVGPDSPVPTDFVSRLKPHRVRRKRLATFCLFLVITIILLGLQVFGPFPPLLTATLIALAGLFAWKVNKTLIRFGWV